jgi:DNA-binding NarL/FixJ family response regulator
VQRSPDSCRALPLRRLRDHPVGAPAGLDLGVLGRDLDLRWAGREALLGAEGSSDRLAIRAALTERELEIFKRLASRESNQDIGRELSVSANTVANHISSILAKLHLDNRIQAAVQAVRAGIA